MKLTDTSDTSGPGDGRDDSVSEAVIFERFSIFLMFYYVLFFECVFFFSDRLSVFGSDRTFNRFLLLLFLTIKINGTSRFSRA